MWFLDHYFKPFQCEVCEKRHHTQRGQQSCCKKLSPVPLTGPTRLIPQEKIVFSQKDPSQSPAVRYTCQRCGATFVERDNLTIHYFSTHLMGKTIDRMKCTECNRPGETRPYFMSYCEHCGGSGFEPVGIEETDEGVVVLRYKPNIQESDILTCPRCHGGKECEICHNTGRVTRGKLHELGFRGFIPPENFRF